MQHKTTHGGPRKNSGTKPKYSEPTKTITFRVPQSKVEDVKVMVKKYLEDFKVKKNGAKENL